MKILLQCFIPIESGPIFTLGLAKGLINNGIDVYAILDEKIENKDEWNKLLKRNRVFYIKSCFSIKKHPILSFKELIRIRNYFRNVKFDYWFDTFPTGACNKIDYVIDANESMCIDHDAIPHSSATSEHIRNINKTISKIDNVVVLSRNYIDLVKRKYNLDDSHVFYMRHGSLEYTKMTSKINYENLKDINFLFFGRIEGYKGLHVLAAAYKKLKEKYSNISLTIAGGGDFSEYKATYNNMEDCTVVNKYLTDEDIVYHFSKPNTVVVLPYLDASQSGVIGMAFNYRTPVIVSDTGGLKEQLFDGEMGLFVEPGNAQDLEDKMEEFILNKKLYKEQKEKMDSGYKRSTWDYVTKEFLAQLENTES